MQSPAPSPSPVLVQMVGSGDGAPWWGVPVIAGGFLIVGAVLGYFFNRIQDERAAKRSRSQQWDETLLKSASILIILARRLASEAFDHETWLSTMTEASVQQMQRGEPVDPLPVKKPTFEALFKTYEGFNEEYATLRLIAPEGVREVADECHMYATGVLDTKGAHEMNAATAKLMTSAYAVEDAVRRHFGIA